MTRQLNEVFNRGINVNAYYAITMTHMHINIDVGNVGIWGTTESSDSHQILFLKFLFLNKSDAFDFAENHFEKQFYTDKNLFDREKLEHSVSYSKQHNGSFIRVSYELNEMQVL
jgi:hypothetical protein